jgi:FlaA1/EpsC-like NDP-sugar epimerase
MKKILITGGAGTVGKAFIKKYYDDFEFFNISRNESQIAKLARKYPKVTNFIGDIRNLESMINIFEKIKPDVVIHAAALKHVNLAELNPSEAVEVNVNGSLNIIKASIRAKVPITIGISTDKACDPDNVYGYTKNLMEKMFLENHNTETKFVCTRFANVAKSNGSVIPFWKGLAKKGQPLKLTDPRMNRLMFSKQDSAELIYDAYKNALKLKEPFILSNIMKNVNLEKLAKLMSPNVEIVGLRPGEKLNETLVSSKEIPYSKLENNLIFLFKDKQPPEYNLGAEHSSVTAEDMSDEELRKL